MTRPAFGVGKEKFFTDQGYRIHGTVQVGVNDGTEFGWFLQQNQVPILGFEPLPDVYYQTTRDFQFEIDDGLIQLYQVALSNFNGRGQIHVPRNTLGEVTQGASFFLEPDFLEKDGGNYWISRSVDVIVQRFDTFVDGNNIDLDRYDLLYVDVQGMELQVLEGMGSYLEEFQFLNIECSEQPTFADEAPAHVVIEYLADHGFTQQTPTLSHNDILFLRV